MQMRVVKADGSIEDYLHTKVIGTINKALTSCGQANLSVAEQLAEVVTYYVHKQGSSKMPTGEIFAIIKAVLTATGNDDAASFLDDYHFRRKLARSRIEVVGIDIKQLCDAHILCSNDNMIESCSWNKSIIVEDLINEHKLERQIARTIASMVEERILAMQLNKIPLSLIKQIVLSDAASIIQAHNSLQTT